MKGQLLRILLLSMLTMPFLTTQGQVSMSSRSEAVIDNSLRPPDRRPDVFTIVYKSGRRSSGPADSIEIAVTDLKKYLLQVIPGATVRINTKPGAEKLAGNLILVDDTLDPIAKKYRANYGIPPLPYAWNSYAISGKKRKDDPAYTEMTHSDTYGFRLWSVVNELPKLLDAQKSIADCQVINESLYKTLDSMYRGEFYPTIALTLHYYALRVSHGLYSYYLNRAKTTYAKSGWNADVDKDLTLAKTAMQGAINDLDAYDRNFAGLLHIPGMDYLNQPNVAYTYVREAMKKDIQNDFVINPSKKFFTAALTALDKSVTAKNLAQ